MVDTKYNLITAKKANMLIETEHPRKMYLNYMRELNSKIEFASTNKGESFLITTRPTIVIEERIYRELKEAGYEIEEGNSRATMIIRW